MGLLLSDSTLFDLPASETMRLLDELSDLAYTYDARRASFEDDEAGFPE